MRHPKDGKDGDLSPGAPGAVVPLLSILWHQPGARLAAGTVTRAWLREVTALPNVPGVGKAWRSLSWSSHLSLGVMGSRRQIQSRDLVQRMTPEPLGNRGEGMQSPWKVLVLWEFGVASLWVLHRECGGRGGPVPSVLHPLGSHLEQSLEHPAHLRSFLGFQVPCCGWDHLTGRISASLLEFSPLLDTLACPIFASPTQLG